MNENKHTPDIKCYRINYNSKYWANVAAKVGNQCSSPVGAVFAVNALCDAYEDIAKQRDELLAENKQLRKDAERYRVLRDSEYQLDEDDPSVSDSFFNQYFGEELDAAVDELKSRFDSTIASVKENSDGH